MKPLVVIGGSVLVVGTAVAGLWNMDRTEGQRAGMWSMPSSERAVIDTTAEKAAKIVQNDRAVGKSLESSEKNQLVAALGGKEHSAAPQNTPSRVEGPKKNSNEQSSASPETKQVAARPDADDRLLTTLRQKAQAQETASQVPAIKAKKKRNIAYEKSDPVQRVFAESAKLPAAKSALEPMLMPKAARKSALAKPGKIVRPQKLAMLTRKERRALGKLVAAKKLSSIDLVVPFDYKSAKINDKALPVLAKIGEAMRDGRLSDAVFVVAGHTDAVGGNKYNMSLSARRARSVRTYLRQHHNIGDKRLVAVGYGEERLKNNSDPEAAENRRVEFINLVR